MVNYFQSFVHSISAWYFQIIDFKTPKIQSLDGGVRLCSTICLPGVNAASKAAIIRAIAAPANDATVGHLRPTHTMPKQAM